MGTAPMWIIVLSAVTAAMAQEDLYRKVFVFREDPSDAYVLLQARPEHPMLNFTVCLRSYTDLTRPHSLFSYATKAQDNEILLFKPKPGEYRFYVGGKYVTFRVPENRGEWEHVCASWESGSGIAEFWLNGRPWPRKGLQKGYEVGNEAVVMLGQEQDAYGGGFDVYNSFTGEMADVHLWDAGPMSPQQHMGQCPHWESQGRKSGGSALFLGSPLERCLCRHHGIVRFWLNGRPWPRKGLQKGYEVGNEATVILGQEQDTFGGGFDAQQSFVGEISEVFMWDVGLSNSEVKMLDYTEPQATPIFSWRNFPSMGCSPAPRHPPGRWNGGGGDSSPVQPRSPTASASRFRRCDRFRRSLQPRSAPPRPSPVRREERARGRRGGTEGGGAARPGRGLGSRTPQAMVEPPNFSWVAEGRLAGLGMPREPGHYRFLLGRGVRHLVSLSERAPPHHGCCPALQLHRFRVPDFTPPTPGQIQSFLQLVEEANGRGEAVAVHCMLGYGRTGTMLACYLVKTQKMSGNDAIREIRRLRPGSIETREQEQAVMEFHQRFSAGKDSREV